MAVLCTAIPARSRAGRCPRRAKSLHCARERDAWLRASHVWSSAAAASIGGTAAMRRGCVFGSIAALRLTARRPITTSSKGTEPWVGGLALRSWRAAIRCMPRGRLMLAFCIFARVLRRAVVGDPQARRAAVEDARRRQRARRAAALRPSGELLDAGRHRRFRSPTRPSTSSSSAPPARANRRPFASCSARALARGDRAVFADPDGGYCRAILRSLSRRRRAQSVRAGLGEMGSVRRNQLQLRRRATCQRPDPRQSTMPRRREWRGYARTFLAAVVRRCRR